MSGGVRPNNYDWRHSRYCRLCQNEKNPEDKGKEEICKVCRERQNKWGIRKMKE